jgi:signal transduction histidine kinase
MKSVIPIGLLVVALVALATLQYQWIDQISLVERQKLEASLVNSSMRFAADFAVERERLYRSLESRYRHSGDLVTLIARHQEWSQATQHPTLVKTLYVADTEARSETRVRLRQIHVEEGTAEPVEWPDDLTTLERALEKELDPPGRRFGPTPFRYRPKSGDAMVLVTAMIGLPKSAGGRSGNQPEPRRMVSGDAGSERPSVWVIARLDRAVMTSEILPALADRHFRRDEGQSYRLAVVDIDDNMKQIYPAFSPGSKAALEAYDYAIDLFGYSTFPAPLRLSAVKPVLGVGRERSGRSAEGAGRGRGERGPAGSGRSDDSRGRGLIEFVGDPRGSAASIQQFEIPGLQYPDAPLGHRWRLLVKNEAGSFDAAVNQLRLRNLGVSFGVFLVLSVAALMLVLSAQRTRALGKLHMEFAAGVSHELRTPLTVLRSAAYNLRSGVVRDPKNVEHYGEIVQKEERRLSGMVEQLMAFAETQSGRREYDTTAVDVADIVDQALKAFAFVEDVKVDVERRIPADLPQALADPVALSQCVQNLIGNAIKYGQRAGSVKIEIEAAAKPAKGFIRLSVMDRGNGVPASDVPHLFEAFYRGSNVKPAMPGNGIGLRLVRTIIEAQQGAVWYEDRPGGGAVFVLTVPLLSSVPTATLRGQGPRF